MSDQAADEKPKFDDKQADGSQPAQTLTNQRSDGDSSLPSVSLPAIATPKGGGAIRSIGETFKANAVTGTGGLSVPLPLSPGRGGAGPKLTLAYDSGSGQGPFGIGWSVDIPAITRRTDRGLPRYRDADDSDEFVLSGAEVLVPALVQDASSSWQRDAFPDGPYQVLRYRPRVESAFTRIERRTDSRTGEIHWRTVTRDNVTSLFGKSAAARLADPRQPARVFRWLLEATFDDRGNVTWFEYKAEDTAGVPSDHAEEHTRLEDSQSFANRYPKRIHYGNRAPLATSDPGDADLRALSWLFEAVFDYGEHDATTPTPDEVQPWVCRADPSSTFRATFDVRTYRLCQRVLMFHSFAELGPQPQLVRSLDLVYNASPVVTTLASITETGWMPAAAGGGGGYTTATMPRIDLGYTPADLQTDIKALPPDSLAQLPGGVDGARYRFIDLDGEGIAGVLTQQAGALYYKHNDGEGQLAHAQTLRSRPNVAQLGAAGQMLTSLDADGQMDLVLMEPSMRGFFERTADGGWSPFRPFARVPSFDPADPNLRFLDLDGDGLADVLVAEDEVFVWSRSLGKDGFERPQVVRKRSNEDAGPTFVFADARQSIFVADMTGDGLVDLVRVRNGEICYWPNLGYGQFGGKITMGSAPRFDRPEAFDPRRLRFGDVDGSGTSDIAYVRPDGVALYLNQAGNRWSDATVVAGIPGRPGTNVELVDLLGTGTACLVWSSPEPVDALRAVRYVDLLASTKPHLLNHVSNNLGLETRVAYASSTSFYLADRAAGNPWVTRLPFPVQVVARSETFDHVQLTRMVMTYRYRHGFYDGVEREFRGFGRVEASDAEFVSDVVGQGLFPPGINEQDGEFVLPPVRTVSWFDTGAWSQEPSLLAKFRTEWFAGDPDAPPLPDPILPPESSAAEARDAVRARKGSLLHREVYADDGTVVAGNPYVVEEHRYDVRREQPTNGERHAVFFTHESEAVARHYERNPADPRVEHSLTIEVDPFGNAIRSAHVAYPRRVPAEAEQGALLATCMEATVVNETTDFYRLGVPVEARTFELVNLQAPASGLLLLNDVDITMAGAPVIAFDATPAANGVQKRVLTDGRTLYLADDLSGPLALGTVESRALVFEAYAKTVTATLVASVFGDRVTPAILTAEGGYLNIDGDWWRPTGRPTYDPNAFYQATALTDPFGNTVRIVLDAHSLLVNETHTSDDSTLDNVVQATNDYRLLHPTLITDANGNQTAFAFDALGMLTATALMGKPGAPEGDTLADPTKTMEYHLLDWQISGTPAFVRAFAREQHRDPSTRFQTVVSYSDGSGHEVLKKMHAEADPETGAERWVGTGRTVFDNKGNPVKKFEPYFAASSVYEAEASIVQQGVTPILRYDPLNRLIRTDFPEGTFETVAFDSWSETRADANDNVLESQWYAANVALPATDPRQRAATLAVAHAHTPITRAVDPLGRTFLVIEDNGAAGKYQTRSTLDIVGNERSATDARGNVVLQQNFDMAGRVLHKLSADAGERFTLPDIAGTTPRWFDGRGFATQTVYDRLRRPSRIFVQSPADTKIMAELLVYGEAVKGGGSDNNLRGRKTLHYDGAGELALQNYDFKGNLTASTRRLFTDYTKTPNWISLSELLDVGAIQSAADQLLESEAFPSATSYDALNRATSVTTPDGSVAFPTYNQRGLPETLGVNLRGATSSTQFVTRLDYNAKGQRLRSDMGSGLSTSYSYNPLSFLLTEQVTVRTNDNARLQNFTLTYDPVHNVVEIDDNADQSQFFSGVVKGGGGGLYTYDPLYRLSSATGREHPGQQMPDLNDAPVAALPHPNDAQALRGYTEQYKYNEVGNILSVVHLAATGWTRDYEYAPDSNRLQRTSQPRDPDPTTLSGVYLHDANGNMSQMPHLSTISWDHANRMQSVDLGGGGTAFYTYDGAGVRVRKVIEHQGASIDQRIYLDTFEIFRSQITAGVTEERETLHVMSGSELASLVETKTVNAGARLAAPTPQSRFQLRGHLGSTNIESDPNGNLISYEEYFPFGATSFHSADGSLDLSAKRYRYIGRERDDETGLYHLGARQYAPWLGRWTRPDPSGPVEGTNLYVYSRNNPLTRADVFGTQSTDVSPPVARLADADIDPGNPEARQNLATAIEKMGGYSYNAKNVDYMTLRAAYERQLTGKSASRTEKPANDPVLSAVSSEQYEEHRQQTIAKAHAEYHEKHPNPYDRLMFDMQTFGHAVDPSNSGIVAVPVAIVAVAAGSSLEEAQAYGKLADFVVVTADIANPKSGSANPEVPGRAGAAYGKPRTSGYPVELAPKLTVGEIKSYQSAAAARRVALQRWAVGHPENSVVAVALYDEVGNVQLELYLARGDLIGIWDIGRVDPAQLPTSPFGQKKFGDDIEPAVTRMVAGALNQCLVMKHPSTTGIDLLPLQRPAITSTGTGSRIQ
jgi:RHS repeat-associated protein